MANEARRIFYVRDKKVDQYIFKPYSVKYKSTAASESSSSSLKPWEEFCKKTKMHGFNFLVDYSKPIWFRIVAAGIILVGISLFLYLCCTASSIFFQPTITTSTSTVLPDSQRFPSIHICDKTYFSRKRLKEMGFNDTLGTYLITAQSKLLMSESFRDDTETNKLLSEALNNLMKPYGGNILQVSDRAALSCEEMIAGCVINNRRYNGSQCCSQHFTKTKHINEFGSCVSTLESSVENETIPSSQRGFTFLIKENINDQLEFDYKIISPVLSEKSAIIFTVSDKTVVPYSALLSEIYLIESGAAATVALTVTQIDNTRLNRYVLSPKSCALYDHDWTHSEFDEAFTFYSSLNCELLALQKTYEDLFNCSLMSIDSIDTLIRKNSHKQLPYCLPSSFVGYRADEANEQYVSRIRQYKQLCLTDCIENQYTIELTHGHLKLSNLSRERYGIPDDYPDGHVTTLHFYFPTLRQTVVVNRPDDLLKWLGEIGGYMGLFLGGSLISIIEVLILIYNYSTSSHQ